MPIFDQGYQHWSGTLSGHAWRWWAITQHGVRVGKQNRFLRILVLATWVPAVVLAGVLCMWGLLEQKSALIAPVMPFLTGIFGPEMLLDPRHFRVEIWTLGYHYFLQIELRLSMIVVLLVGPALISQDLRFNALPLYFSRPLRRADYFLGKLGVIGYFLGLTVIMPSLIAYVLGLLFSRDFSTMWDTFPLLLACLAYGAVIVLSAGTLMLALSSLSRNSRYIALFWVGLWFVSSIVAGMLDEVASHQRRNELSQKVWQSNPHRRFPDKALPPEEQLAQQRAWQEMAQKAQADYYAEELRALRTNWRPLVSYTANLSRIGQQLLGTDHAFRAWSQREPPERREMFLMQTIGPQYPWYWSAGVLAALFGLSAWILNSRVRSLDRLK
jgi:ABC-2 type transport system permease protein